jgi:hypothetical protein
MGDYSQEQNNNLIGEEVRNFETSGNNLEDLLDLIAEALIQSSLVNTTTVEANQKFILNGQLQQGSGDGVLALFQKDIKANQEDLNNTILNNDGTQESLQNIANSVLNFNSLIISVSVGPDNNGDQIPDYPISITLDGGGLDYPAPIEIIDLIYDNNNPLNVSQFIPLSQQQSNVDIDKANEFLDTNIFELLPTGDTRQARIIRFFQELNALLPPSIDDSDWDSDNDGRVDREQGTGNWEGANQYNQDNSISYAQDNQDGNIDEEDAFIHRLTGTANDTNSTRTIEEIYNRVLPYLRDILEEDTDLEDGRPEYRNQSSGYLQFRNPNQGIIIRNTNQDFIEGLNPETKEYLTTGFTITMWVRFLDKVSEGTLFNFGNPIRGVNAEGDTADEDAFGFKLETFVINKDDEFPTNSFNTFGDCADALTNYNTDLFDNSNTARFVRLVVNDNGQLRDSHLGCNDNFEKLNNSIAVLGSTFGRVDRLLTTTHIPEDFNEWYFICASFNPAIEEDDSHDSENQQGNSTLEQTPDYWLNHIVPTNDVAAEFSYTTNSGYGNKCKVEIISKTDLLRARGFKVD